MTHARSEQKPEKKAGEQPLAFSLHRIILPCGHPKGKPVFVAVVSLRAVVDFHPAEMISCFPALFEEIRV
jgi:hypothetical protein